MLSISVLMSAAAASRNASLPERTSMLNSHRPGITLMAPPGTSSFPTVPTNPGSLLQRRSTASTISAAPAAASRRSGIRTVPACPDSPSPPPQPPTHPPHPPTTPLLLRKRDDLQCRGQLRSGAPQRACDGYGQQDAQPSIELSGIDDGIVVRTRQQALEGAPVAGQNANHIAHGIGVHGESRSQHEV